MGSSIFDKQPRLKPSAMVTVAQRRFEDARALCETGKNIHANGAQYLCGFVVEVLLKSQLVRRYPWVASKRSHEQMSKQDRAIWSLVFRSHDLEEMLNRLHGLEAALVEKGQRAGWSYMDNLRSICATWTIHARYSTRTTEMGEARDMLERVRKLKEVLR
jgi:hypothetical protein